MINDTLQHQGMRKRLAETVKEKGISDENVIKAIASVPRHLFLESGFVKFAYKDQAFPIGAGQTISHPFTVAYQSQLLGVKPNNKILEVGTGSGYQSAVLIELGANVYTIERQKELYVKTQQVLPSIGYRPKFFYGDGYKGLPTYGPFDGIVVTAGAPFVPQDLKDQLKIGAKLVIPVNRNKDQVMTVIEKIAENEFIETEYGNFAFVPLLSGTNE